MKEIKEILERVSAFATDERGILATVVDVQGSGYRLPGARMLILENGDTFGMVSGGCLEADVLERAKKVLSSGRPEVFTYDTTDDENSVFSLNMGCRGIIRILLEAVDRDSDLIKKFRHIYKTRVSQSMATLIATEGDDDSYIGERVFFREPKDAEDLSTNPTLARLHPLYRRFVESNSTYELVTVETGKGDLEFALETVEPPLLVLLFGAGADAVPLARIASDLGWQVSVFDHRPVYLTTDRFPAAENLVLHNDENPLPPIVPDTRTVAVIMTHNYQHDRRILPHLLRSGVGYIAGLGPKRRTEQLLGEIAADGEKFTEQQLARLYAPAGLDIGADTPEAIALSIVAEIQSVLRTRGGGHLRDRTGSIYDRKRES